MPRRKNGNGKQERDETSAVVFVRLANARGSKAVKAIRNMQNLNSYEHAPQQTRKIIDALAAEINALEKALTAPKGKTTESLFEL